MKMILQSILGRTNISSKALEDVWSLQGGDGRAGGFCDGKHGSYRVLCHISASNTYHDNCQNDPAESGDVEWRLSAKHGFGPVAKRRFRRSVGGRRIFLRGH